MLLSENKIDAFKRNSKKFFFTDPTIFMGYLKFLRNTSSKYSRIIRLIFNIKKKKKKNELKFPGIDHSLHKDRLDTPGHAKKPNDEKHKKGLIWFLNWKSNKFQVVFLQATSIFHPCPEKSNICVKNRFLQKSIQNTIKHAWPIRWGLKLRICCCRKNLWKIGSKCAKPGLPQGSQPQQCGL